MLTDSKEATPPSIDWVALCAANDLQATEHLRSLVEWIGPPSGARILDAGCGTGGLLRQLAEAASSELVGLDSDDRMLEVARSRVPGARLIKGDVLGRSAAPGPFDLVIARSMVHHLPDQILGIRALAARLAPGGTLILGEGGLATSALPYSLGRGAPGLEGRLRVAADRWFDRMRASLPGSVPFDGGWGLAIESAGLRVVEVRTFLDEQPPPVADQTRLIVEALLRRYLGEDFDDLVSDDDRATVRWLLDPNNPDGIAHRADLHLLGAQSLWRCVTALDSRLA